MQDGDSTLTLASQQPADAFFNKSLNSSRKREWLLSMFFFFFFFCQFLFQPTWRQFLLYKESTWIISFHYISHKATKSRPPVCADISEHVTHGSWNCNLHFDRMHFIFSCVISNRCLRVLISVPRSLLLLTWETDTFLNAYNCREERTRPFDLSCGRTGFQWGKLGCTEVLQCFQY